MMHLLDHYFPSLPEHQRQQFMQLEELYRFWNQRINVISRNDIENLEMHHVLFSLAPARYFSFLDGTRVMDAGTGGGFPGIPLAILFPGVRFTLVDSIAKKIRVVTEIAAALKLENVEPVIARFEQLNGSYEFITARAVADLPTVIQLLKKRVSPFSRHSFPNGILYLKGGDVEGELKKTRASHRVYALGEQFKEPFFKTKILVHIFDMA